MGWRHRERRLTWNEFLKQVNTPTFEWAKQFKFFPHIRVEGEELSKACTPPSCVPEFQGLGGSCSELGSIDSPSGMAQRWLIHFTDGETEARRNERALLNSQPGSVVIELLPVCPPRHRAKA